MKKWRHRTRKSKSPIDDFIVRLFTIPGIWIIFTILMNIFSSLLQEDEGTYAVLKKISLILLILTIGWFFVQVIRALFHYWQKKFDINNSNNLEARKRLTLFLASRLFELLISNFFCQ
jgi:hypothetical protein